MFKTKSLTNKYTDIRVDYTTPIQNQTVSTLS